MEVPFVDLYSQHAEVRAEIDAALKDIIDRSQFIGGQYVAAFEEAFAAYCGVDYAVACANGTDALKLALAGCGVQAGDEVVTVPNTFMATVEAVHMLGAFPALVDVDPESYTMSPEKLDEFLSEQCVVDEAGQLVNKETGRRVTAVIPVHLYGLPADMKPILALAAKYNLQVIEDACQAHGAFYQANGEPKRAGSLGRAAAFSFYPGKNLGAMGEGGAVTTHDADVAQRMKMLRDHGQSEKYIHARADGWNSRLDTMQCAVLSAKLKRLDGWNNQRRQVAAWYREELADVEQVVLPVEPNGRHHVYHLFVVRVPDREKARQQLTAKGIGVGLHYPIPLHQQPAYAEAAWQTGDFPETETAAAHILSLPMFPHMTRDQVQYVCKMLKEVFYTDVIG
ncbi:MAG: DegT/DnrJ/EryC1/StrS family aminotransferase [Ardenticatenaceae bacterium]|nr:DegT/DnrJ/EryC1/StrS family aminotransferase [Ardenticatenaceae bacterium]